MNCNPFKDMDHRRTETRINFLACLDTDVSVYIMSFVDDPADLVRACAVSRFWLQFVITNGLAKMLCLKVFPQLSTISDIHHETFEATSSAEGESSNAKELEILDRNHKVYASLLHAITKSTVPARNFIAHAVSASSTDNYPVETVSNTLHPRDRFEGRASYWSSKGQRNPELPETLIYQLKGSISVITQIDIQPFEGYGPNDMISFSLCEVLIILAVNYILEENRLQPFKLPEPILCLGGYLQIKLSGRVQRCEIDRLFYICVSHVQVLGRPLIPAFGWDMFEPSGKIQLSYCPEFLMAVLQSLPSVARNFTYLCHQEDEMSRQRFWEDAFLEMHRNWGGERDFGFDGDFGM